MNSRSLMPSAISVAASMMMGTGVAHGGLMRDFTTGPSPLPVVPTSTPAHRVT